MSSVGPSCRHYLPGLREFLRLWTSKLTRSDRTSRLIWVLFVFWLADQRSVAWEGSFVCLVVFPVAFPINSCICFDLHLRLLPLTPWLMTDVPFQITSKAFLKFWTEEIFHLDQGKGWSNLKRKRTVYLEHHSCQTDAISLYLRKVKYTKEMISFQI